jgi:hypothetical protein
MNIHTVMVEIDELEHCQAVGILGVFFWFSSLSSRRAYYQFDGSRNYY